MYLSICPIMKWVKMYNTTISVIQYYIEKLVCLLFLNRPFKTHWFFLFYVYLWKKELIEDGSALS